MSFTEMADTYQSAISHTTESIQGSTKRHRDFFNIKNEQKPNGWADNILYWRFVL